MEFLELTISIKFKFLKIDEIEGTIFFFWQNRMDFFDALSSAFLAIQIAKDPFTFLFLLCSSN